MRLSGAPFVRSCSPSPCPWIDLRVAALGALLLAACGSSGKAEDDDTGVDVTPGLSTDLDPARIAEEEAWVPCGGRIECRQIEVPIDHGAPDGDKLSMALTRSPAWEGYERRGVIVVNPGGPGAPGRPFLEAVEARRALGMLRGFDLIGFDPRGVGDSGGIPCAGRAGPMVAFEEGGTSELIEYFEADARGCAERVGSLFGHLGSHDVVLDIELMRQVLGEEQLNFLGASYGTRLAALYAETFPEHVRAFVLDSPVHPVADLSALVESQFEALIAANDELISDCSAGVLDCPYDAEFLIEDLWNRSVELHAEDSFAGMWKSALAQPSGREDLADILYTYLIYPEFWDEAVVLPASSQTPQEVAVNQAVHCTDQSVPVPSAEAIDGRLAAFAQRSAKFAVTTLPLATCAGWHMPLPNPVERLTATGAPPLLLIGGEHDILTPMAMAEELHASLSQSVLVRSGHYGHGAVTVGMPCIDDILTSFFERLELPADGTRCP